MNKNNEKIVHKVTGEIFTIESIDVYEKTTLIFTTCKKYFPVGDVFELSLIDNLMVGLNKNLETADNELIKFVNSL
jgi:hypothetical protein